MSEAKRLSAMKELIILAQQSFAPALAIEWSDEDEAYVARVPALPGCCAHGDTVEEAARETHDAMCAWVEAKENCAALAERQHIVEALRQEAATWDEPDEWGFYGERDALRAFADRLEATGTTSEAE